MARAVVPDLAIGAHTASLGLAFYAASAFPQRYRSGAFIGQHGSWNRSRFAGYKVIFVPFQAGHPSGPPEHFSPDGRYVLTAARDRTAILWETESGRPTAVLGEHPEAGQEATFSSNGKLIITKAYGLSDDQDRQVNIWKVSSSGGVQRLLQFTSWQKAVQIDDHSTGSMERFLTDGDSLGALGHGSPRG